MQPTDFCTKECCKQVRQDKVKVDREAEKGEHYYRQRKCEVCGSLYWPTHSQQKFCSEECQKINHNKKTLSFTIRISIRKHYAKIYHRRKNRYPVRTYRRLLLPLLMIEEPPTLSKYGGMRAKYLKEHKKVLYFNLLTSGKLNEHLVEVDTSACNMAEYLTKEMAKRQGVTEQLKATDMMKMGRNDE